MLGPLSSPSAVPKTKPKPTESEELGKLSALRKGGENRVKPGGLTGGQERGSVSCYGFYFILLNFVLFFLTNFDGQNLSVGDAEASL